MRSTTSQNAQHKRAGPLLQKVLSYDAMFTKMFSSYSLKFASLKSLKYHCSFLEISCNGIFWLAIWIAYIWIFGNESRYQMQLNMLLGLILDIVFVAIMKAVFRRRRPHWAPQVQNSELMLGPDKYSFPSGHSSRAFYLLIFFTQLCPVPMIWWMPMTAWACSVVLSRLILTRHYILDVTAGILLGIIEAYFLKLIWISQDTSSYIIKYLLNDNLPTGDGDS